MFHLEWLLPILLAFWILVNLIRKTEEERRSRERGTQDAERPPAPSRPRRANTDIDRFLEEVNRRRQAGERKPRARPETRPGTPRIPVPVPPPRLEAPPPIRPPVLQAVEAVLAIPVAQPVEAPKRPAVVPARETKAAAAPRPAGPSAVILDLLRSKESLRAALILREILSPPLCRRGARGLRPDSE
jgi:hypothetical protein